MNGKCTELRDGLFAEFVPKKKGGGGLTVKLSFFFYLPKCKVQVVIGVT